MARSNGKIMHISHRGVPVDMDAMRSKNEASVAMGNASMNARGDILNSSGNVVVKREQIIQAYHKENTQGVKQVSLKDLPPDTFETPQQAVERLTREANTKKSTDAIDKLNSLDLPSNVMDKKAARKLIDKAD